MSLSEKIDRKLNNSGSEVFLLLLINLLLFVDRHYYQLSNNHTVIKEY